MKKSLIRKYFLIMLFGLTLIHINVRAQLSAPFADSIYKKIELYHAKNNGGTLFLHFDKNIYTNNENVWFTAYLMDVKNLADHNTLSVALISAERRVVVKGLFVMDSGIAFGNFFLPDTIAPGNYDFVACTNQLINGLPAVSFTQPITIKTTAESSFTAAIALDSSKKTEKRVFVKLSDKTDLPILNNDVEFKLIGSNKPITLKKTTDILGKAELTIPTGVKTVEASVSYNKVAKKLKFDIPDTTRKLSVKFYPEGGSLVENITSTVGWEAKNEAGEPMQCSALLYENGDVIDTIFTEASGLGRFRLRPKTGATYSIAVGNFKNRSFLLPKASEQGDVLTLIKGLANDTLMARLTASESGKVYVMVHNYDQSFYLLPIQLKAMMPRSVKIDLSPLPRGVAEITVLDSLKHPIAERLFFAGYKKENSLTVNADKLEYKTRQKVTVSLDLKSALSDKVNGAVSIACVQSARVDPDKLVNIESYVKLQSKLNVDDARKYQLELNESNKPYLEDVLLIKGWRRYNWSDMLASTAAAFKYDSVKFNGYTTKWEKPVAKQLTLVCFSDSSIIGMINTDSAGRFKIDRHQLLLPQGRQFNIFANTSDGYSIVFNNPYQKIRENLAKTIDSNSYWTRAITQNTGEFLMKGLQHSIQLKEVKIKDDHFNNVIDFVSGKCTDYVCIYNILNCPNHQNGSPPVNGGHYTYRGRIITYHGSCSLFSDDNRNVSRIDPIWISKEFYAEDYEKNNPKEAELQTTVYWKNLLPINNQNKVDLSFYTSDVTGNFKVIVQGITNTNDVIYGTASFKVSK